MAGRMRRYYWRVVIKWREEICGGKKIIWIDRDLFENTWKHRRPSPSIAAATAGRRRRRATHYFHPSLPPPSSSITKQTMTIILKLFLLLSIVSLDAFLTPPPLHTTSTITSFIASSLNSSPPPLHRPYYSTILRADASSPDGSANESSSEEDVDNINSSSEKNASLLPSEEASDILSSPTFLKRKVEVLQSDIAALEKEIEEANAVVAKGKEEWLAKFDMLTKEVWTKYCMY